VRYRGPIVERLLTDKHIRAWTMFIDSSADVLLALEDDAVFLPDSLHRLAALLARVKTNIADPVYVDLAGGFPLRKIVGVSTGSEDSAGLTAFDVPFTNTTCGYLVTRPLVISMLEQLTWRPELRDVGIDWLMNELMMRAHLVMPIICLHSDPPLFNHGSLTGAYPSDIVMRPITKRDP
jgi:GR25 family glycosyltransferase involved in LPS biosynthesis